MAPRPKRPSLFEAPRSALRGASRSSLGPVAQALAVAVLLASLKWGVGQAGLELQAIGVGILTALLGAVVFTLAIVFAGVLADFKEAERGLGEMVSAVRRLHWDLASSGLDAEGLAQARGKLATFVDLVLENARHGFRWRLRDLHSPLDAIDALLVERGRSTSTTRSSHVGLATLTRNVDRLETIVETTFMRAGYAFSAAAISALLACFLLAPLGPGLVGPGMYATIAFVLVGLYLLVRDLDNPLAGSVSVSLAQVEKLAAFLKERRDGAAVDGAPANVVAASPSHAMPPQ